MIRHETNEEVRGNLAPAHVALFNRVASVIKGSAHATRTEVFHQYVIDHPGEEIEAVERVSDFKLKQHLRPMLDFYETPGWAVRAILPVIDPYVRCNRTLDPGCGTGAIIRELIRAYPSSKITGVEKDEARFYEAKRQGIPVTHRDFFFHEDRADLIVSNPPYSHALQFVQHALKIAPRVCMLLRLPWLASMRRAAWHRENPAHVCVLPRRPSFTGDGKTDATEYAWFVWGTPEAGRYTILNVEKRGQESDPDPWE